MANESILIVDDNPTNVRLIQVLLASGGYVVRSAGDSQEALRVLESFQPQLILMDIQLPGMDGLQLTRNLKADPSTRSSIIVALTAYAMSNDEAKSRQAGCDGYLSKPIDTRTFPGQIRNYLDGFKAPETPVQDWPDKQLEAAPPPIAAEPPAGTEYTTDVLRDIRTDFIAAGAVASRKFLKAGPGNWDVEAMARALHHWAGIGGTLGFSNITEHARLLERLIEAAPIGWEGDLLTGIQELRQMFAACKTNGATTRLPSDSLLGLVGRQVALVGFIGSDADRVRAAFEQVAAIPSNLGSLADGLGLDALDAYDLVILNAGTEEGLRSWRSVSAQPVLEKPFLLIASRSFLFDRTLDLLGQGSADFVFTPWDREELLFRAQRVIQQKRPQALAKPSAAAKPIVVIADDDPTIHAILGPMLRELNFDLYSVKDGSQALDMIKNLTPAAVILDIAMPRGSGISVLTAMRRSESMRRIPVLMLTARQQEPDVSMALAFGANEYVVKPFDPVDLVNRLERLIPRRDLDPA